MAETIAATDRTSPPLQAEPSADAGPTALQMEDWDGMEIGRRTRKMLEEVAKMSGAPDWWAEYPPTDMEMTKQLGIVIDIGNGGAPKDFRAEIQRYYDKGRLGPWVKAALLHRYLGPYGIAMRTFHPRGGVRREIKSAWE